MTRIFAAIIFAVALVVFGGAALAQDETPTEFVCDPAVYGASVCDDEVEAMLTATAAVENCPSGESTEDGTCVVYDLPEAFATTPEPTPDGGPIEGGPPTQPQIFGFYCEDFPSLADAQSALDDGIADPAKVDPDYDGVACEGVDYDHEGTFNQPLWECSNYPSIQAAQEALEGRWYNDEIAPGRVIVGNPDRLDPDGNGVACDHDGAYPEPTPTCDTMSPEDAQAYVDAHFGGVYAGNGGPLDPDGDGIACNHNGSAAVDEPASIDDPTPTEAPSDDEGAAYVDVSTDDDGDAATVDGVATDEPIATEQATDDGGASVETPTDDDDATGGGTGSVALPKTGTGHKRDTNSTPAFLILGSAIGLGGVGCAMRRKSAR